MSGATADPQKSGGSATLIVIEPNRYPALEDSQQIKFPSCEIFVVTKKSEVTKDLYLRKGVKAKDLSFSVRKGLTLPKICHSLC